MSTSIRSRGVVTSAAALTATLKGGAFVVPRALRPFMPAAAGGLLVGLLSLSTALAQSTSDIFPVKDWTADIFAATKRNQSAISDSWSDALISGYARSERLKTVDARWLPQPMPAVDGINAKIDAFGGGANHTNGFYGTNGSLAFPLAQQWGAQVDGGLASVSGSGVADGAAHVFWRDPSIGLLGAYGSYERWKEPTCGTLAASARPWARSQQKVSITWDDGISTASPALKR
jgi:hypothetical protein